MLSLFKQLHQRGVMSINRRNADYVLRYNPRKLYPIVDDKLATKRLAMKANIAVPTLHAVIDSEHQIREHKPLLEGLDDFVIKPAHGAGGDGILVIDAKVQNHFRKASGALLNIEDITYHLSLILSGAYSLGGHPDVALIEHRVQSDPVFAQISHHGVPDVRVITLLGYPAMAMVRLPTRLSDGKANLHQGAIGAGIELVSGKTLGGVWHNETIEFHPDTLHPIADIEVPHWDKILHLAASCYELTGLGYLGVDIVLDKTHGPLMLELNARPGLNIQIANRAGLLKRFEKIEAHASPQISIDQRITFSLTLK